MKRLSHIDKLKIAIAASALVGASVQPAVSYEINPATFLTLVQQRLDNGEMQAAQALILRMRAFGVTMLMIGNIEVSLDELLAILTDPTPASRAAIADLQFAARTNQISFMVGNRIVTAIDTERLDAFPVGSAG